MVNHAPSASAMLKPITVFAQAHRWKGFYFTTAACGALALIIARIPLPQVGIGLRDYSRAVGFFITPLLPVPALSLTLTGFQPYEHQAARSLVGPRFVLVLTSTVWVFAVLMPAALTGPTPNAVEVLVENCSAVLALTLLLGCWVDPRWAWVPVFALTLVGVSSPDYGWLNTIAFVDRNASAADLIGGLIFLAFSMTCFALHGPPGRPRA